MSFGLIIIVGAMLGASFILIQGIRGQAIDYFGHEISRSTNRSYFWFSMFVAVLVIAIGIWILPSWLNAL